MSNFLAACIVTALLVILIFLIFAFVVWNVDPDEWHPFVRAAFRLCVVLAFIGCIYKTKDNE